MIAQRTRAEMLAYADNCLNEADRLALEERMAGEPEIKRQIAQWQAQNQALRTAFGLRRKAPSFQPERLANRNLAPAKQAPPESLPLDFRRAVRPSPPQMARQIPRLARWARSLLFLATFGVGFAGAPHRPDTPPLAALDLVNFQVFGDIQSERGEFVGRDISALRKLMGPAINRIVFPDIVSGEWTLTGGRVVAGLTRPAALLIFENRLRERASILIDASELTSASPIATRAVAGVNLATWSGSGQALAIASRAPIANLTRALYEAAPASAPL